MAEPVDAEGLAELADRREQPFLAGELLGGLLFGGSRAVEIGELGVHRDLLRLDELADRADSAVGGTAPDQCQHVSLVRNWATGIPSWCGGTCCGSADRGPGSETGPSPGRTRRGVSRRRAAG